MWLPRGSGFNVGEKESGPGERGSLVVLVLVLVLVRQPCRTEGRLPSPSWVTLGRFVNPSEAQFLQL